jgi:hypothetical protein
MQFFTACKDYDDAKALYYKLSNCFHPDKGGDMKLMTELNKQYEDFKKRGPEVINVSSMFMGSRAPYINRTVPFDHPIHNVINDLKAQIQRYEIKIGHIQKLNEEKSNIIKTLQNENIELFKKNIELGKAIINLENTLKYTREHNQILIKNYPCTLWERFFGKRKKDVNILP